MKNFFVVASLVTGLFIAGGVSPAQATVINFSSLSASGSGFNSIGGTVTQDGFNFTSTDLGVWQDNSANHPGGGTASTSLLEYYGNAQTTISEINNFPFQLNAIDLAPWGANQAGTMNVTFVGTKSDSSTIQQTFTVNNSNGSTPVLQQFIFSGFTDLVNVKFTQGVYVDSTAYQFNNLIVNQSTVPEPATIFLFSAGLVGLIGAKWKKLNILEQ